MKTIRTGASYENGKRAADERYEFDFKLVPTGVWAQVDSSQDAWYYGTWANPFERVIINFCEGDLTRQCAESDAEFVEAMREWAKFDSFRGIDPGFGYPLWKKFCDLGLGDLIHDSTTKAMRRKESTNV